MVQELRLNKERLQSLVQKLRTKESVTLARCASLYTVFLISWLLAHRFLCSKSGLGRTADRQAPDDGNIRKGKSGVMAS